MSDTDLAGGSSTPWKRFIEWLNCLWELLQDLGRVLRDTRLSIAVTLLAGLALVLTGQGQDLVVLRVEGQLAPFFYYVAIVFWAVNAWYWARVTLSYSAAIPVTGSCRRPWFAPRKCRVAWLIRHVPRAIGTGAFALIAIAQFKASLRSGLAESEQLWLWGFTGLTLFLGGLFYWLVATRRIWAPKLGEAIAALRKTGAPPAWLMLSEKPDYNRSGELPVGLRRSFAFFGLALLLSFLLATFAPTRLTPLSADVVFLVGASLWIAPGTRLILAGRRGRLPILSFLVALALVFSFFNDNHAVRKLKEAQPQERHNLERALADWNGQWPTDGASQPHLILVATAGGGSRAAYWTGNLLGTLQDLHPDFNRRLFAISGVSGGSVGAAAFRSLLERKPDAETPCHDKAWPYRDCARAVLGQDFLTATLSAMIFPDLVQRFLPYGFLPDRAAALEESWEAAWSNSLGGDLLARNFFASWPQGGEGATDFPALLLNGTSVATGRRIVTSNLDLEAHLTEAIDLFARCSIAIRMSTAADNSARFPIVGPAGTLARKSGSDPEGCAFERRLDRIVDGGYFENFGAETALDVLQALRHIACGRASEDCGFKVIVIQISSDPGFPGVLPGPNPSKAETARQEKEEEKAPLSFASELLAPVETLLNTRSAHGALAARRLRDWVQGLPQSHYVEFRLVPLADQSDPPLGWLLSDSAKENIDCQLAAEPNRKNLTKLSGLLGFELDKIEAAWRGEGCR